MRVSKFVFRRRLGNACANSMSFWLWVYLLVCSLKFILYIMIAQTIFLTYCQGPTMVHFTLRKAGFQVMNRSLQILFSNTGIPANICWSWRRLQHVFSLTILRLPRRLATTPWRRFQELSQDVLENEKLLRWRLLQDVLKTCLEDVLNPCLEDVLKKYQLLFKPVNPTKISLIHQCKRGNSASWESTRRFSGSFQSSQSLWYNQIYYN